MSYFTFLSLNFSIWEKGLNNTTHVPAMLSSAPVPKEIQVCDFPDVIHRETPISQGSPVLGPLMWPWQGWGMV